MTSPIRSILVHIDATGNARRRLAAALALAAEHGAALTALYAMTPAAFDFPLSVVGDARDLALCPRLDAEREASARAIFVESGAPALGSVTWAALHDERVIPGVTRHALYADLMILGQPDAQVLADGALPPDFVPELIASSGRPALILPSGRLPEAIGRRVLIAWKPTRVCASAVTSALPLLRRAEAVRLVCVPEGAAASADDPSGVLRYLRLHGIDAQVQHAAATKQAVGEQLMSLCAGFAADLLVMGCYGHSRLREFVLGGATRQVLSSMTLPVWMAH